MGTGSPFGRDEMFWNHTEVGLHTLLCAVPLNCAQFTMVTVTVTDFGYSTATSAPPSLRGLVCPCLSLSRSGLTLWPRLALNSRLGLGAAGTTGATMPAHWIRTPVIVDRASPEGTPPHSRFPTQPGAGGSHL
jgi:hypothetical protein